MSLRRSLKKYKNMYQALERKLQRETKKVSKNAPDTPRIISRQDLLEAGINPFKAAKLRNNLIMAYTLNEEIKNALKTKDKRTKKAVELIIGGKLLKKYRFFRKVSSKLGLCRNRMAEINEKILKQGKRRRSLKEHGLYRESIVHFLERCDNSTVHPNKQGIKIVDGTMKAKRILNDYLDNVYDKFLLESPNAKVSRSTFFICRPTYMLPVSFSARRTCLCLKHQNMTLMLKVLQLSQTRGSSEMNHSDEQVLTMIDSLEEGNVKYSTWKRVEIGDGKKRMNIVMVDIPKEEFKLIFIDTMHTYLERISN